MWSFILMTCFCCIFFLVCCFLLNISISLFLFVCFFYFFFFFFFFQAEDGIRDHCVTGVQTCALPIFYRNLRGGRCEANHKILDTADGFNLSLKDVHNAGKSWLAVNKDVRLLGAEQPWQLQQDDAMEALINREWQMTKLDTIRESDSKFLKILIIICMLFSHD